MLETYIRNRMKEKPILLMTHLVLGYPDFGRSMEIVSTMAEEGVDMVELQIPFSEPLADGPVISRANHLALEAGSTLDRCLDCAGRISSTLDVPLIAVSYYNPVFRRGPARFAGDLAEAGFSGAVVPDLPPEEGSDYLGAMGRVGLDPVLLFAPSTPEARMRKIASLGAGFIYCVSRGGVTGGGTSFEAAVGEYLARCRAASKLPIAVGFGIGSRKDVEFLIGRADVAVVGTRAIRAFEEGGIKGLRTLLRELQNR